MAVTDVAAFDSTLQKTHMWLEELSRKGHLETEAQAYSALRAVLHVLRDRLMPEEAVHLGAQLPMLIRGFYYEGWNPSKTPTDKLDKRDQFVEAVANEMRNLSATVDAEAAVRAVFELLNEKITQGEIQDVRQELPKELRELWPA